MLCFWKQQNEKICATGIKFWSHGWNCVRRSFFLFFPLQPLFPQPLATTAHDFIDDCENLWNCGNHRTSIDVQQNVANMGIQSQNTNGQREREKRSWISGTSEEVSGLFGIKAFDWPKDCKVCCYCAILKSIIHINHITNCVPTSPNQKIKILSTYRRYKSFFLSISNLNH